METKQTPTITANDIVVERNLTRDTSSGPQITSENGMLKVAGQDFPVDGPKPDCDGND
jgi:hypothetical protein